MPEYRGHTLYRIEALKDLPQHNVKVGDLGGWIESEKNLSGNAWVGCNAKVYGNGKVYGNAKVCGVSVVFGNSQIYDNAVIDNSVVAGNARVFDRAHIIKDSAVFVNAKVYNNAYVINGSRVCDNAKVFGCAFINDGEVYGKSIIFARATVNGSVCDKIYGGNTYCSYNFFDAVYNTHINILSAFYKIKQKER